MTIAEQLERIGLERGLERGREEGREEGLEEGLERGREEGLEEGLERGREEERLAIARSLFELGLSVEKIGLVTGLSEAEIQSLRTED